LPGGLGIHLVEPNFGQGGEFLFAQFLISILVRLGHDLRRQHHARSEAAESAGPAALRAARLQKLARGFAFRAIEAFIAVLVELRHELHLLRSAAESAKPRSALPPTAKTAPAPASV
jgi:hypothetical protein